MTTLHDEPLRPNDAFAWRMEHDPVLRSTIVAVMRLATAPSWEVLRPRIDRLTRLVPRLRMRVAEPGTRLAPPRWDAAEFDLDFHLRRLALPAGSDWGTVLEFARTAAMDDFDRTRPLWEFTLLDGLPDGGAAFVTKIHHSLTDGIGGMELARHVIDLDSGELAPVDLGPEPSGTPSTPLILATHGVEQVGTDAARLTLSALRRLPGEAWRAGRHPFRVAVGGARDAISVGRMVRPILRADSTVFGTRHAARRLATLQIPFEPLHAVARATGCHVNDAYLAALTDGVGRYHAALGTLPSHLRITVPISQRGERDGLGGNRITLVRIRVPVGDLEPHERVRAMARVMGRWRREPALAHTEAIATGLTLLPRGYIGGMLKKVDLLASDVPGLPCTVYLAGARVTGYYGFGPTIGAALNCTMMSYDGSADLGLTIDTGAVADPDLLVQCVQDAFDDLLALAPHQS